MTFQEWKVANAVCLVSFSWRGEDMIMNNKRRPLFRDLFLFFPSTHKKWIQTWHTLAKAHIFSLSITVPLGTLPQCDRKKCMCTRAQRADVNWGISCQGIWIIAMGFSTASYLAIGEEEKTKIYVEGSTQETERKIVALLAIQPTNIVTIPLTGYNTKRRPKTWRGQGKITFPILSYRQINLFVTLLERPIFENIQGQKVLEHLVALL